MSLLLLVMLAGCAESDPYKRLEPGLTASLSTQQLVDAYSNRWPAQFKCVQTVTIDFGPVTKTFNALLIIQRSKGFRLLGMTEHGIKIFELTHNETGDHIVSRVDEMTDQTISIISRDIQRVFFLDMPEAVEGHVGRNYYELEGNTAAQTIRVQLVGLNADPAAHADLAGSESTPVEGVEVLDEQQQRLFCYRCFEWYQLRRSAAVPTPSVIVLRDSGRESKSYPYKLTIKITELTVRDTPWPEKTFKP